MSWDKKYGPEPYDPVILNLHKLMLMADKEDCSKGVRDQIKLCMDLHNRRDDYCDKMSSDVSPALENLFRETEEHPWKQKYENGYIPILMGPAYCSGKLEDTFLKSLVSMSNAKTVLEIGLFTGSGALAMAEALPSDGKVVTCEILPYICDLARSLVDKSPHGKKISIRLGPALDSLNALADKGESFDFIFLDADKAGYLDYYKVVMEKNLLTQGGTIAVDNVLMRGTAYSDKGEILDKNIKMGEGIKSFNNYVVADDRVCQVIMPSRDGVMLIRRKEDFEGGV